MQKCKNKSDIKLWKINFKGNRYVYQVDINQRYRTFEVCSKHLYSKSYSTITNINYVISELSNSLSEKDIIEELTWKIETINKLDMLIEKIEVIFKNQKSIEFLENQLDQDRLLGVWNSNIKFK